jgi:hypothetical protein
LGWYNRAAACWRSTMDIPSSTSSQKFGRSSRCMLDCQLIATSFFQLRFKIPSSAGQTRPSPAAYATCHSAACMFSGTARQERHSVLCLTRVVLGRANSNRPRAAINTVASVHEEDAQYHIARVHASNCYNGMALCTMLGCVMWCRFCTSLSSLALLSAALRSVLPRCS